MAICERTMTNWQRIGERRGNPIGIEAIHRDFWETTEAYGQFCRSKPATDRKETDAIVRLGSYVKMLVRPPMFCRTI